MTKQELTALMAVKCELSKQLDFKMIGTERIGKKAKYREISVKIDAELNRLYEMEQTSKNLMVEINLLCELLTLKNCEIADLQQTLNERD